MWYDVIVVGGGPAGATATYELARRGFEVILLERRRLPRFKACGGCLSPRVVDALGFDVKEVVEEAIYHATFTYRGTDPFSISSADPMGYMVERSRFDHLLCRKAVEAGAKLREGEEVKEVQLRGEGIEATTPEATYLAKLVIGADGVGSVVRRKLIPTASAQGRHWPAPLAALEGRIASTKGHEALRGRVLVDFGLIPGGYAWAFPKADHVNIGVMGPTSQAKKLKGLLFRFLDGHEVFAGYRIELLKGAFIPAYDGRPRRITGPRAFLIGDAAFLVDPLLGEGIYYAIRSAQLASQWAEKALLEGDRLLREPPGVVESGPDDGGEALLQEYQTRIAEGMSAELRTALKFVKLASWLPGLSYRALKRRPGAVLAYADLLRGKETYEGLLRRAKAEALAALRELVLRGVRSEE